MNAYKIETRCSKCNILNESSNVTDDDFLDMLVHHMNTDKACSCENEENTVLIMTTEKNI